jgi:hypothetical protein
MRRISPVRPGQDIQIQRSFFEHPHELKTFDGAEAVFIDLKPRTGFIKRLS